MSQDAKRKRRSSDPYEYQENNDYHKERKKSRLEISSSNAESIAYIECTPSSSHVLFQPDVVDHADNSSECDCASCQTDSSKADDVSSNSHSGVSELDAEIIASGSEINEKDYDNLGYSLNSQGYQCKKLVHCAESMSSPIGSIDTDFEDDERRDKPDDCDDVNDAEDTLKHVRNSESDSIIKAPCKAVTFMGQLTPGSSVGKVRPGTPDCPTWTSFRRLNIHSELYAAESTCPVPQLSWANRKKFWEVMCRKDEFSLKTRNPDLFDYQMYLKPRMRVILLDWISEVASVFKLHRETYYLTIDYIDRYLSTVENIPKQQLQLIGVTCLVLASKMEEIYPPKIDQLASVTDGACTEEEIFSMEVTILGHLNWLLSPITVNSWLEMMLQFIYEKLEKKNNNLLTPHFSSSLFKKLCQLLDLVTLDYTSLRFSYCVLAASAIYILVDSNLAISTSGLKKEVLEPCVQWMSVYWKVLRKTNPSEMADVSDLLTDKSEIFFSNQHPELQTHNNNMQLYESVQFEFESLEACKEQHRVSVHLLTPPSSSFKCAPTVVDSET